MTEVMARLPTSASMSLRVFDGNCLPYCIGGFSNLAPLECCKIADVGPASTAEPHVRASTGRGVSNVLVFLPSLL